MGDSASKEVDEKIDDKAKERARVARLHREWFNHTPS